MLYLNLFRHGESSSASSGSRDFDRPLAPRGEATAPLMGHYMAEQGLIPDLVLCSTAHRARATLELALPAFDGQEPEVLYEEVLYHAAPGELLDRIRRVPGSVGRVMVVGHNPGMHALAVGLGGQGAGPGADIGADIGAASPITKFPTAALAVIGFDLAQWRDVGTGQGRLEIFVRPKDLRA